MHLIKTIKGVDKKKRYQIGNNRGGVNGWISESKIYGILTNEKEYNKLMENIAQCGHCKRIRRKTTLKTTSVGYVCFDHVDCWDEYNK